MNYCYSFYNIYYFNYPSVIGQVLNIALINYTQPIKYFSVAAKVLKNQQVMGHYIRLCTKKTRAG